MAQSARKKAQDKKNLVPSGGAHKLTVEEASKGGKRSGEVRRQKKELRELLEHYLNEPATVNGQEVTRKDVMAVRAIQIVTDPNTRDSDFFRAFELVRDTIGEKPTDKVTVESVDQANVSELLEQWREARS